MSSRSRRARALVVLALATLVALPTLALTGSAPASPTAQVAKRRCARARRCRRSARRPAASGGVPRPFNPLFSADRSLRVLVSFQQERGGKPRQIVEVRAGNVVADCPTSGEQRVLVVVQVPLRGSSFVGAQTDSSGGRRSVDGRFLSATKAVGSYQATFPDVRGGGDCETGRVSFTATR